MDGGVVGLVGCGLLGSAIGERLIGAGFSLAAYDLDAEQARGIVGAELCSRVEQIGERSDRIVFSLPNSKIVGEVLEKIHQSLRPETLIVDTTTGDPAETERIAADLAARGSGYVDATVGGSSAQARRGEVIVMAGGKSADVMEARPILDAFAERVFHVGPCGSGSRMKLVMNLVLGLNRAVLAEGLSFADVCGLDGHAVLDVLQASPASSAVMDTKGRKMLTGDYQPEARLAQHLKDVRLILDSASHSGLPLPLSALHRELLEGLVERGFGDHDNSVVRRAFGPLVE